MATSTNPPAGLAGAAPEAAPAPAARGSHAVTGVWARWLWPSLFDVILVSLPLWFFGLADGGTGLLLSDGDTGWHIRTGEWILNHRAFVWTDLFSFTKPGQEWFAWEWLSDVLLALAHRAAGLQGVTMAGMVVSALFCGALLRHMAWRGVNIFIALPLALMGFGMATVHLLARPHLLTMLLMAVSVWMVQADLRRPRRWIWLLVPLAALWTNLHGGWLALISILGLTAAGRAVEAWLGQAGWDSVKRYAALTAGCLAASLLNPYGWRLHRHMAEYLTAGWIKDVVMEFQSPEFRSENMLQFELVLLAACAAAGLALRRKEVVGPLWVAFWAHSSLQSGRHIPLFAAVALPLLADELQRLWRSWTAGAAKNSVAAILQGLAEEAGAGLRRASVWSVIPFVLIAIGVIPIPWRKDFPAERFPVQMVTRHEALLTSSRVFTEDQWADYLIYRFSPRFQAFFDGRSDFYGEKITRQYQRIVSAAHDSARLLDQHGIEVVLARPNWALAAVLKRTPGWEIVEDDKNAVLFRRTGGRRGNS